MLPNLIMKTANLKVQNKKREVTIDTEEIERIMGGYFVQFLANKLEHQNERATFCHEI